MSFFIFDSLRFQLIVFFVSLIICAFYSFLETSITGLRLFKLKEIEKDVYGYNRLFDYLEKKPNKVLITILLANNIVNVMAATSITRIMENAFVDMPGLGITLGISIATAALLIFGEVIPKNFARGGGEKLFKSSLWITNLTFYALYPIVTVITSISNFILTKLAGRPIHISETITSEREIQFLIDYISEKGLMESDKTEMLRSIFKLGVASVKDIMVPANDIISLNLNSSMQNVLELFAKYQYTRFPVYDDRRDNIVGMVYIKDLFLVLFKKQDLKLKDIVRPILFVPESMKLNQMLSEFKNQKMHIAIVVDEYGLTSGLVTLEDVLEEIVGEIVDEHELGQEKIVPLTKGGWMADATIELEKLGKILNITFDSKDAVSLGGFLIEKLQELPKKGGTVVYDRYVFRIQKTTPKRVLQVYIRREDSKPSIDEKEE